MVSVGQGKVERWVEGWGLGRQLAKPDLGRRGYVWFFKNTFNIII